MADYINGKDLFDELKLYKDSNKELLAKGIVPPPTDKISHAIVQIANRLSNSFNFVNYSFKDEMIGDGILKCFRKFHKFDCERSENPFAYFSQICWNAFIERIKTERRETSIKAKMINEKMSSDFVSHGTAQDDPDFANAFVEFLKENEVLVDHYAEEKNKKYKVHESLVHRNKTEYKKVTRDDVIDDVFDLSVFEDVE
jgi:DNA-directed RNA polymerase specialized sigma24 family protein